MLDKVIDSALLTIHTPFLNKVMEIVTNFGNEITILILSAALFLFLLEKKEYVKAKFFAVSMVLGGVLMEGLKHLVKRARPITMTIHETGYSFPSGHATMSMVLFGMLIVLFASEIKNKEWKNFFIGINVFLILIIGFSRLYFNVHYPTDILGGWILGFLTILFSDYLFKKIPFLKRNKLFW